MVYGDRGDNLHGQIRCWRCLPDSRADAKTVSYLYNWRGRPAQVPFPAELRLEAAAARYEAEAGEASGGYFVGVRRAHAAAGLLRRCGLPGQG